MIDFGFKLSPSSRINFDNFDSKKFAALNAVEPDARRCIACGSCAAVCTAGRITPTSLRLALAQVQKGQHKEALELLKACQLCGKCAMVCPRGINTRHLIISIIKEYSK